MKNRFYVFLDESGNTGDIILTKRSIYNFNDQPYFVLGGFGIKNDETNLRELMVTITKLKKNNGIHSKELKGARLWPRKLKFIYELFSYLYDNDIPLFIELMDKKFFVIASIANIIGLTSGILTCTELFDNKIRIFLNRFADYLSLNLSPETIIWFSKASRNPSQGNIEIFLSFLQRDSEKFLPDYKALIDNMLDRYYAQLTEYILNPIYSTPPWEYYVSPEDPKIGIKRISLLPHTTAATNIFARINKYSNGQNYKEVLIIHDQQEQWNEILKNELRLFTTPSSEVSRVLRRSNIFPPLNSRLDYRLDINYRILFGDSEKTIFLQLADVISGSINKLWREFKQSYKLKPYSLKVTDILFDFSSKVHTSTGINLVIPKFEYEALVENLTGKTYSWESLEYGTL